MERMHYDVLGGVDGHQVLTGRRETTLGRSTNLTRHRNTSMLNRLITYDYVGGYTERKAKHGDTADCTDTSLSATMIRIVKCKGMGP